MTYKSYVAQTMSRYMGRSLLPREWGHLSKIISKYSEETIDAALQIIHDMAIGGANISVSIMHAVLNDNGNQDSRSADDIKVSLETAKLQGKQLLESLMSNDRSTVQ